MPAEFERVNNLILISQAFLPLHFRYRCVIVGCLWHTCKICSLYPVDCYDEAARIRGKIIKVGS
jgi:hypothetical protein